MYDKVAGTLGAQRAEAIPPNSPFVTTDVAMERASQLAGRVAALADRLVGIRPSPTNATGKESPSNSLFQAMEQRAQYTINMLDDANMALNSIENQLP